MKRQLSEEPCSPSASRSRPGPKASRSPPDESRTKRTTRQRAAGAKSAIAKTLADLRAGKIDLADVKLSDIELMQSNRKLQTMNKEIREVYGAKLIKFAKQAYSSAQPSNAPLYDTEADSEKKEDAKAETFCVINELIKSLVRKLHKTGQLLAFVDTLKKENSKSPCFTILKGLDGRIQVSTRKFQPHLCYPRIFRFPEVQSARDLRPVEHCTRPFTQKNSDQVCINPFHFELVSASSPDDPHPSRPKTLFGSTPPPPHAPTGTAAYTPSSMPSTSATYPIKFEMDLTSSVPSVENAGPSLGCLHPQLEDALIDALELVKEDTKRMERKREGEPVTPRPPPPTPCFGMMGGSSRVMPPHQMDLAYMDSMPCPVPLSHLPAAPNGGPMMPPFYGQQSPASILPAHPFAMSSPYLTRTPPSAFYPTTQQPTQQPSLPLPQSLPHQHHPHPPLPQTDFPIISALLSGDSQPPLSELPNSCTSPNRSPFLKDLVHNFSLNAPIVRQLALGEVAPPQSMQLPPMPRFRPNTFAVTALPNASNPISLPNPSPENELVFWAEVYYHEYDQQLGLPFKAYSAEATIDGFTSIDHPTRLSLGSLKTIGRTDLSKELVQQLGKGIRIRRDASTGNISLLNLSTSPVFVLSRTRSLLNGEDVESVHKVVPDEQIEIFDMRVFRRLLTACSDSFSMTFELQKLCSPSVSFVKGFSSTYRRMLITETPSWVEIILQEPLQMIDRVLRPMNDSVALSSSFS